MTLTFKPETTYGVGFYPAGIAVADVNGDSHLDVISADYQGGVDVLLGTGTGTFAPATVYHAGQGPVAVAVADVNGDGRPDIVADGLDGVEVLFGNGAGSFSAASVVVPAKAPLSVAVVDLNGDGNVDLAVGSNSGVQVLLGNGAGGFTLTETYSFAGQSDYGVSAGDVNGDGLPDFGRDKQTRGRAQQCRRYRDGVARRWHRRVHVGCYIERKRPADRG